MKFLFLLHGDAEAEAPLPAEERMRIVGEHMAYTKMLRDLGVYVSGEALDDPRSSVVVRPGENPIVTDGPFAETKEAIGGFYVIDVADMDVALDLCRILPEGYTIEVRPVIQIEGDDSGS